MEGVFGWRRARVIVALVGAAFGVVVVLLSFLPGASYLPDGIQFIPFILAFPCFGWAIIEVSQAQSARRRSQPGQKWYQRGATAYQEGARIWADVWANLRRYQGLLAVVIPLIIGLWLVMMFSITSSQGQPEHDGNHYYLDDHGSHIPVTKAGYEYAVAVGERGFAAAGTLFLLMSVGITLGFDPKQQPSQPAPLL